MDDSTAPRGDTAPAGTEQLRARRRSRRTPTKLWRAPVRRVHRVTPKLARVTLGGDALADFAYGGTDAHVKLYFYPDGAQLPADLTLERARSLFSTIRPRMRSYTVRRHDPVTNEVDIDFVLHDERHGDAHSSPAARWAAGAEPGDELIIVGPSPAYAPDPATPVHLLAGDETALPAIAAILAELPAGARAIVHVEVADAAEEQDLASAAATEIHYHHRHGAAPGRTLADAIRDTDLGADPANTVDAWAAGERDGIAAIRAHLLDERRLDRRRVRPTSYWRSGHAEDG